MTRRERRTALLLAALAFAIVLLIWQIPQLTLILIPFRYFVTTIHELGHGLAAILTGGHFVQYVVHPNGAGVATTAGGIGWLVKPAGYIGTALFGAFLLYFTNQYPRRNRWIAVGLGVGFALLTLLFARNLTGFLAGGLTAAVLVVLGWKAPAWLTTLLLNVLAFLTGLNALLHLWGLLGNLNANVIGAYGRVPNDAYAMSQLFPLIPAAVWALLWLVIAVGLLGAAAYYSFWQPVRNDQPAQTDRDLADFEF